METGIKTIPMEKKYKKSKMAIWGGLTNSCQKKRRSEEGRLRERERERKEERKKGRKEGLKSYPS